MASRIMPAEGHRLKPFRTPRKTSAKHLSFIKSLPCVCCLAQGRDVRADDPMHIRAASRLHGKEYTGKSEKSDDRWTLPGCRRHHDEQHSGNELQFWKRFGLDPFLLALILWGLTGDEYAARLVLLEHAHAARVSAEA